MQQIKLIMVMIAFLALTACAGVDVKGAPSGAFQAAPDFTLPDQDGKQWKLSDVLKDHRAVVLAFYPVDDAGA